MLLPGSNPETTVTPVISIHRYRAVVTRNMEMRSQEEEAELFFSDSSVGAPRIVARLRAVRYGADVSVALCIPVVSSSGFPLNR